MKIQSTMNKRLFFQTFVARAVGPSFPPCNCSAFFVFVCFTDKRSRVSYRSRGHIIGISLTTITHSIIFRFTELNSSHPCLVAAVCQDLKKINSAETIRGNTVHAITKSI